MVKWPITMDMNIARSNQQITLFFDPSSNKGKQTLAYAKTSNLPIREVDLIKSPITGTQLVEIADTLHVPVKDLADTGSAEYHKRMKDTKDFTQDDWIKVLTENPELLKSPIIMKGDKAMIISTPTDILQF